MHLQHLTARLVLGLGLLCGAASSAGGADWSRFRGPNGTGTVDDKNIPVEWKADAVQWKTEIPGKGHSSPVLWGDNLFLQAASKDGSERWLLCLSVSTGKILWKQTAQGSRATTHVLSSLASGTPAVDGERVYTTFWDGKNLSLSAFNMKGEQQWRRDLGAFKSQHGAGHSPLLFAGKVILADDQDESAVLFAFDAKTGEPGLGKSSCSGVPAHLAIRRAARAGAAERAAAVDRHQHGRHYRLQPGGRQGNLELHLGVRQDAAAAQVALASPIIADGLVVAPSGDGSGERNMIGVRLGGKGDVTKNCTWPGRPRPARNLPHVPCLIASGQYVFSVNDFGLAACHVAEDGSEKVWERAAGR